MRLIDADALIDGYKHMGYDPSEHPEESYMEGWCKGFNSAVDHCVHHAIHAPTIEPEPKKRKWIPVEDREVPYGLLMACSECGTRIIINDALEHKYCSECGSYNGGSDEP